ncbi:MAG TPA: DUF5602 domain-containing protein [Pyrinomonadaceae bacterium]|nr:DUF5602 domain-containing protein [Pyrinomonadaceae bacterium]
MSTRRVNAESFQRRALAALMAVDRIFLRRELFVTLAAVLMVSGLVFAQRSPKNIAAPKERTIVGETKPLGAGTARSWVRLDRDGNPTAVGVTFSENALATLPKEPPAGAEGVGISLALPAQAAKTAFKHIGLDFNPHGHEPVKIYDTAHFDFHFYMISEAEREAITATGEGLVKGNKQPAAEFIPEGYVNVPNSVVPRMGSHWVNPAGRELNGQPFTTTFLFGSYDGRLIFAEPMITKSFLEMKTNVTEMIKLPKSYERPGAYYPTKYTVRYDAAAKEYTVALEGMTLR